MRRSQPPRACCATRALLAPVCPRIDTRAVCMGEKPGGVKVLAAGASREFDNRGRGRGGGGGGRDKGERGGSEGSAECPWRALQHQHQHHRQRDWRFQSAGFVWLKTMSPGNWGNPRSLCLSSYKSDMSGVMHSGTY